MSDKFLTTDSILAGTTSVSIQVTIVDESTGAGRTGIVAADLTGSYWRQGGLRTAITLAALGSVNAAYSSGGFIEVDATNMPGTYRLDLPDAALATGADWATIQLKRTAGVPLTVQPFVHVIALPTYATLRDTLFAKIVETQGNYTAQQALSILLSVLAGVTSTQGSVLKTPNGSATRVSATINASNERTAMTLTPSA